MLYILDQYGNKTELNPTFKMVGLPYKREYSTTKIPGLEGELQTTEPVLSSVNRSIHGTLYGITKEEVRSKRDELADVCGRGLIKVGHEEEGWYVEGQCISFDHKYSAKTGKCIADVSITIKCDDPHQKAEEVEEELIITPSDYPEKIEMLNPHPSANVRFGTFDVETGEKISDESVWHESTSGIYTGTFGHGFTFDCYRGFSLSVYHAPDIRKFKVFDDGIFLEEYEYQGSGDWKNIDIAKFKDGAKHRITVIHTAGTYLSIEAILPTPANLPVLQNPGTVTDYPVLEVEPADTEALFSPLGKKVGDAEHPFSMNHIYNSNPLVNITPDSTGITPGQIYYDALAFLDGDLFAPTVFAAGHYACWRKKIDLKAPNSPYFGMTVDEIKNNMQSILSELWGYARGAIEVGDPSFGSGVNGFAAGTGVVISQSSDWAKTGTKSLKIVSDGTQQYDYVIKSYGNQAGKKISASLWVRNNESTPANIRVNWLDITSGISASAVYETIPAQTEIKITLPEYNVPVDSQGVKLAIYPAFEVLEPATIYIDDVTVTSCGLEMYVYNGIEWVLAAQTGADYPWKMAWNITSGFGIQDDGKICFLLKAKYPSDGISPSAIYLDHCKLGTVMNYAKLGADAITNYGGNLNSPFSEWQLNNNARILSDYDMEYQGDGTWSNVDVVIPVIPGAMYSCSAKFQGRLTIRRDSAGGTPLINELQLDIYSNMFAQFIVPADINEIYIRFDAYNTTKKARLTNLVLAQTDTQQHFKPQDLRMLEFSEDVTLVKGDLITADTKRREIDKNGERLYSLINQSFKFFPLMIFGGLNHFKINHTGANLKVRLKYQPKWR